MRRGVSASVQSLDDDGDAFRGDGAGGDHVALAGSGSGAFSASKGRSCSVADVADADGVFVAAKEDEVVSERHHPPVPGEWVSREALRQGVQRLARIEQPGEVAVRRFAAPDSWMM